MKWKLLKKEAGVLSLMTLLLLFSELALGQDQYEYYDHIPEGVPTKEIDLVTETHTLAIGKRWNIKLPKRYFVWGVHVNVTSNNRGDSGANVEVNGSKVGNVYAPRTRQPEDPPFYFRVERETGSITLRATPATGPEGLLHVLGVSVVVSETDRDDSYVEVGSRRSNRNVCRDCRDVGIKFPTYYKSVMGNVSNRAIILVDRLVGFSNYRQLGEFLLPIKKAAAKSRAMAEAWGDASHTARPYYEHLLETLDDAEPFLDDKFEMGYAFRLATELLGLREYIRRILT